MENQNREGQPRPICRRCHRALRDPKSVAMGLGPVCARKAARDEDEDSQARLEPTIADPARAKESMARVARWLAKTGARCSCGSELSGVESFDHDGGFEVPGYGRRQWIYSHCEACGRDIALGKLGLGEAVLQED